MLNMLKAVQKANSPDIAEV